MGPAVRFRGSVSATSRRVVGKTPIFQCIAFCDAQSKPYWLSSPLTVCGLTRPLVSPERASPGKRLRKNIGDIRARRRYGNGINMRSHQRTYPLLVRLIYSRSNIGILATVVNASILVWVLWDQIARWRLAVWFALILSVSLVRYALHRRFVERVSPQEDIRHWDTLLKVGLAVPGILWGATGIALFPAASVPHQVFIAFVIAGMVAGAVGVFSPIMPVFMAFSLPALTPITIRFFLIGDSIHMAMGAMLMLFGALTFATAKRIGVSTEQLVNQLEERTDELSRLNENLENAVSERTENLRKLATELTLVEQRERRNLGKVLHDGLQQYLVAAKMQIGILGADFEDAERRESASAIERLLGEAVHVSRSLAAELSPPILRDAGILGGLTWLSSWMREKHGLRVELVAEMDSPPLDESVKTLLFESVREMLLNVVKHAGSKSATVRLFPAADARIGIAVSDRGSGFDAENSSEVFHQKGFGLFSIRERLQFIGGTFDIDSSPGKGCRITLSVPRGESGPLGGPQPAVAKVHPARSQVCPGLSNGRIRILIVDDHIVMREGLARLLAQEPDFEVVGQAADGQTAIESAASLRPDLILMDISMPVLDGVEATKIIHSRNPQSQIIGLSLYTEKEKSKEMLDAGAFFYMSKSEPPAELKAAIRSCCAATP